MAGRGQNNIGVVAIVALIAFALGKCAGEGEPQPVPAPVFAPPPASEPVSFFSDAPAATHASSRAHGGTSFANCSEARAAGAAPVYAGEPGYAPRLDRDSDGVGCE
jgi:hypothetical protein